MSDIRQIESERLSTFRTHHVFEHYAEFKTVEEFQQLVALAHQHRWKVYVLGNGSNTLFRHRHVRSLILHNRLPRYLNVLDEHRVEVSSSTPITTVLKHCEQRSLDSFYYLASVPATIGGALAMNAGRGKAHNMTIYDFVESITYVDGAGSHVLTPADMEITYRKTMFTGVHDRLIASAVLKFPALEGAQGKIRERIDWSKDVQDHSSPNCGSVFREARHGLLSRLKGFRIGKARYSPKVGNWILNESKSSRSIRLLISTAKCLHLLRGSRAQLELIEVD